MLTFADFRRRSAAYHALIFRRAEELMTTWACGAPAGSLLRIARERNFDAALAAATPFFWLAALRVVGDGLADEPVSDDRAYELAIQAWDSFADLLGDAALDVNPSFPRDLCFPKHGVGVRLESGASVRIDREVARDFGERVAVPIDGAAATLLEPRFPALFETPYASELCVDRAVAAQLRASVSRAFAMLSDLDDDHAAMVRAARYVVPLNSTSLRVHRSFTSPQLKGVIFLSLALDDVRLAEAIVHESKHTELNVVLDATPLFDRDDEAVYYSPWRDDARPIAGLYHGIYVFAAVARFHATLLALDRRADDRDFIVRRIEKTAAQTLCGIAQIDRATLNDEGRAILDSASAEVEQLAREHPPRAPIAEDLAEHERAWIARFPHLALETDRYAAYR